MTQPLLVILGMIVMGSLLVVFPVGLATFYRYRGRKVISCPETRSPAKIQLNEGAAMRTVFSQCVLIIAAVLAITVAQGLRGQPAIAQSPDPFNAESWLDRAVAQKHCPLTPLNVSAALGQISIVGDTLQIQGTDNPDHIVIRSGGPRGFVRVEFDGIHLGFFGPVARILVQGGGGDNVIIVGQDVGLPARLEGGPGDDCLQGGSGGDLLLGGSGNDVLIAGTGRPALKTGTGSSRIVVPPQRMGGLDVLPSARAELLSLLFEHRVELLPLLDELYTLRHRLLRHLPQDLGQSSAPNDSLPNPIVVAPADLTEAGIVPLLQQTYAAGQAIVLINATADQATELRGLLGHPNAAKAPEGDEKAAVIYFRKAQRQPGSMAYDYSTGIIPRGTFVASALSGSKERIIELLSRIFSATAIVPSSPVLPSSDPTNDLTQLANSYTSHSIAVNSSGSSDQITNSVWGVRSFTNQADYYYVQQEYDFYIGANQAIAGQPDYGLAGSWLGSTSPQELDGLAPGATPALIQTSPASTQCSETYTHGVNWNIGGSAGWNKAQGVNGTLSAGVTVTNSTSENCPPIKITNKSNPATATTEWQYAINFTSKPQNYPFYHHWIWEVPWTSYRATTQNIYISGSTHVPAGDAYFIAEAFSYFGFDFSPVLNFDSVVPLPFGTTFALEQPNLVSVTPTCVAPGAKFHINGTALYPSMVTSVLIGGTPLSSGNYFTTSDTLIDVIAPSSLASQTDQRVVVQTELGPSNDDLTIRISATCGAGEARPKGRLK